MNDRLAWDRDELDWPHRDASRFVEAAGLKWHVQTLGQGPAILLIHGTGASTHSWRRLMPLLARSFEVVAPDLPGHGFTAMPDPRRLSLPGMADALGELTRALEVEPVVVVGHSAGAAIAIHATQDGHMAPRTIVSINGALLPFGSLIGQFFSPLAKLLVSAPSVAHIAAWRGQSRAAVEGVISGTGSRLATEDIDLYSRLFASPGHVAAALGMMANWDLHALARDLPHLATALILVTAPDDRAISPNDAEKVCDLVPKATIQHLTRGGHLVHEEYPAQIADLILRVAAGIARNAQESCRARR